MICYCSLPRRLSYCDYWCFFGNQVQLGLIIKTSTVITTGRPPSFSGGRCWLKSEQRSFVMYRRNIYEQYGGYNLLQNAEFKANFSMKVFPRSNIHLAKKRLKQHGIVEKNMTHHSVNIFFKILFKKIALNSAFWNKLYPPYCLYVFLL